MASEKTYLYEYEYLHNNFSREPECDFEVNDKFYECRHLVEEHEVVDLTCKLCRINFSHGFKRNITPLRLPVASVNLEQLLVLFVSALNVALTLKS